MTPKQEAFARAYVETGNASEAYRRSYSVKTMSTPAIAVEACGLLKHPSVALMVADLQSKSAERHEVTIDSLTVMAKAAYDLAMKDGVDAPAAAISAVLAIGKLHGLIVDKKETKRVRDGADLSLAELYDIARMGSPRDHQAQISTKGADSVHALHVSGLQARTAPHLDS